MQEEASFSAPKTADAIDQTPSVGETRLRENEGMVYRYIDGDSSDTVGIGRNINQGPELSPGPDKSRIWLTEERYALSLIKGRDLADGTPSGMTRVPRAPNLQMHVLVQKSCK